MSERDEGGFLSRWSRRKAQVRGGAAVQPAPTVPPDPLPAAATAPVPMPATAPPAAPAEGVAPPPLPTMDDVAALTRESDYARFVMPGVDDGVKSAAMKKLFSDPHFNVMDGLDTYIDDYNKPDPIPLAMLRQMNQSKLLRLFDDDEKRGGEPDDNRPTEPMNGVAQAPPSAVTAPELIADDHDADLQLQPDDAAGRPGPGEGSGA